MGQDKDDTRDLIIIGAGVAGLSLARALTDAGQRPLLLERSRRVGGRCATMHVDGQAVDHGVALLHGRSSSFRAALDALKSPGQDGEQETLSDWPLHVRGEGLPCQPQGFDRRARRLALTSGVRAFPEHLARGVEVRCQASVERLEPAGEVTLVHLTGGEVLRARTVVVTLPAPSASAMIEPLGAAAVAREIESLVRLLGRVHLIPCLTLAAGYPDRAPDDGWHLRLPPVDSPIHSLFNDGTKRPARTDTTLVIQGRAGFSRAALDHEPARWGDALLAAAAELLGDWVMTPAWRREHRWTHARVQRGDELSHPVLQRLDGGAALGLCGEAFNPAGGVEGAYLSGLELAARLMEGAPAGPETERAGSRSERAPATEGE